MKLSRVVLASAVGVGASGLGAFGQQATPPVPTTQAAPLVLQVPAADVGAAAQSVWQAPDPSAAVAAYAAAVGRVGAHLYVEDAYVRRMVEFNLPNLAEAQAQDVVKQDPNNDVARAVVAYVQGRRGQAVEALATIVQATGGERADPFVLRTAGQLVAWYDTRADKGQIPDQLKADVEAMRQKLAAKDEYGHAYAAARDAYNGQPATASAAPPADAQPQQQPLQPQPQVSSYDTSAQAVAPAVTEVPPPVTYDDSYVYSPYPYGYSSYYYYRPSYYWPRNDGWGRSYGPAYVPPVVIPPNHHHHDWDHGHDWHDGHGSGHGSGDHDGHDGNHGGQPGGSGGGGGGQSPRVNTYNDTHVMRSRDDNGPAKRAIEPGTVKDRPTTPPQQPKGRDRADAPSQPAPQPRQQRPSPPSDGGGKSPKADVTPRTERKPDPPAAARPAPSSPAQQPRSNNDRSGSQQQQQQQQQQQRQSNDRGGRSR